MPKKFKRSDATGEFGYDFVASVVHNAGCKVIEYPGKKDSGLDGHIEFVVEEEVTGKLVAFQVKHGAKYWRERPFVQTSRDDLEYWHNHALPVIVIVVAPNKDAAYWIDVKAHIDANPGVVETGPYTLYPPLSQKFDEVAIMSKIMRLATRPDFGAVMRDLSSFSEQNRLSGVETAIAFRAERRACFALTGALILERDREIIRAIAANLSYFLSHPESSFRDIPDDVRAYLVSLLTAVSDDTLYRILDSFNSDDFSFVGSHVEEIFHISDEEVWPPQEVFERGSVEQSMAVVAECIGTGRFARIIQDTSVDAAVRCGAVVFYAHCERYGLEVPIVRELVENTDDSSLRAWLTWLLFWMERDEL